MREVVLVSLVGACLLTGCVTSQQRAAPVKAQGVSQEQAVANRAKPYLEGMEAVRQFSSESGCDGESVATAQASIRKLAGLENMRALGGSLAYLGVEATERRWEVQFGLADAAKSKGCLDLADGLYRELVTVYVGSAYSGVRDRARLGIDDVRAARK